MDAPPAARKGFDPVAYLKLFRFPLCFTAIADSVTGYLVSFGIGSQPGRALGTIGLLAGASAGLYAFGMALNDIADRKRDQEIAPTRVLPSGRISLAGAIVAALAVLTLSALALYFADFGLGNRGQRFIVWGVVVAAIVTYDCLIKLPPVMGIVRAGNFLLGVATGAAITYGRGDSPGQSTFQIWHLVLLVLPEFLYVTALTFVSTLEEGAIDRKKLWIGSGVMMACALLMASWIPIAGFLWRSFAYSDVRTEAKGLGVPWLAIFIGSFLFQWIFRRAWQAKDRKGVMLLVRDGIGGIIVLNVTLLMSLWMVKEGIAVAALILPAVLSVAIFKKLA